MHLTGPSGGRGATTVRRQEIRQGDAPKKGAAVDVAGRVQGDDAAASPGARLFRGGEHRNVERCSVGQCVGERRRVHAHAGPVIIPGIARIIRNAKIVDHDDRPWLGGKDDTDLLPERQVVLPVGVQVEERRPVRPQQRHDTPQERPGIRLFEDDVADSRQPAPGLDQVNLLDLAAPHRDAGMRGEPRRRDAAEGAGLDDGPRVRSLEEFGDDRGAAGLPVERAAPAGLQGGRHQLDFGRFAHEVAGAIRLPTTPQLPHHGGDGLGGDRREIRVQIDHAGQAFDGRDVSVAWSGADQPCCCLNQS